MKKSLIESPVTKKNNAVLVETFSAQKICKLYADIGLDVKRFFDNMDEIALYECKETAYRFYYPFSLIGDALFYEDLSKNRTHYYSERWEHHEALKEINTNDSILEIGAGFGAFATLLKQNAITDYTGLELNPHAVEVCLDSGFNVKQQLVEDEVKEKQESYNVVCTFQVLEHVAEVNEFIQAALNTLKKGGKLIIGVPNNNPYLFISDKYHTLNLPPHHAGLWNEKAFRNLEAHFPIKLEKLIFEPLDKSYDGFYAAQRKRKNVLVRKLFKYGNKFFPKQFKKLICKSFNGRNILVVYKKK